MAALSYLMEQVSMEKQQERADGLLSETVTSISSAWRV